MTNAHAKFPPSGASRWLPCNGSLGAEEEENEPNAAALFGTQVHAYVSGIDMSRHWTAEQQKTAEVCKTDWLRHVPPYATKECKIHSKHWPALFFGTIDAIWPEDGGVCHIADLKTGLKGVNVINNVQLMCYALLAADSYSYAEYNTFTTHIVQPLRFYSGTATYTREELNAFRERVRAAIEGPIVFVPGGHCEFCPLNKRCVALQDTLAGIMTEAQTLGLVSINEKR